MEIPILHKAIDFDNDKWLVIQNIWDHFKIGKKKKKN